MIQTVVTPEKANFDMSVSLPDDYVGKEVRIKLPDAIIAPTALAYDYTHITNNEIDFRHIDGLKMINPYTI